MYLSLQRLLLTNQPYELAYWHPTILLSSRRHRSPRISRRYYGSCSQGNITLTLERDWNITDAVVFHSSEEFTNRERLKARKDSDLIDMLVLGLCNETGVHAASTCSHGDVSTLIVLLL